MSQKIKIAGNPELEISLMRISYVGLHLLLAVIKVRGIDPRRIPVDFGMNDIALMVV